MSKIRIRNFGPIKAGYLENDGFLDVKKVTVFIGNQGSGKSTVAKLISMLTWLEKEMNRNGLYPLTNAIFEHHSAFQGISSYFKNNTEIEYVGDKFSIHFSAENVPPVVNKITNSNYITPKITYIPAERNTLTTIGNMADVTGMPKHLFVFYQELRKAQNELKGTLLKLPINDYEYKYDEHSDTSYVVGPDYKINLLNASSGVQTIIPLYLVSRNLAHLVTQTDEMLRKSMKAESIHRMNEEMAALEVNDDMPEEIKIHKRKSIKDKYLSKCFINIVEEPEQNLFPSSQRLILNSLLKFNNMAEGNKLIMTTHSPYIISFLSIAIQSGFLREKIHSKELLKKLDTIVPQFSSVRSSDVVIYQLDEVDGSIRKLPDYEGIPSDSNFLNQSLAEGNTLFDLLLEIEQDL